MQLDCNHGKVGNALASQAGNVGSSPAGCTERSAKDGEAERSVAPTLGSLPRVRARTKSSVDCKLATCACGREARYLIASQDDAGSSPARRTTW